MELRPRPKDCCKPIASLLLRVIFYVLLRNLGARDLGWPLYLLTINEKFYKISFLPQILAMVIFCFPPISMKGTTSNVYKTSDYRAV